MYVPLQKKENTLVVGSRGSKGIKNSVAQRKNNGEQGFGFVDNRPESVVQRKMQSQANITSFLPIQKKEDNTGLPDNLKSGIENLSGYSMDDVKVDYSSSKPAQLQAYAYAQGSDIRLTAGQGRLSTCQLYSKKVIELAKNSLKDKNSLDKKIAKIKKLIPYIDHSIMKDAIRYMLEETKEQDNDLQSLIIAGVEPTKAALEAIQVASWSYDHVSKRMYYLGKDPENAKVHDLYKDYENMDVMPEIGIPDSNQKKYKAKLYYDPGIVEASKENKKECQLNDDYKELIEIMGMKEAQKIMYKQVDHYSQDDPKTGRRKLINTALALYKGRIVPDSLITSNTAPDELRKEHFKSPRGITTSSNKYCSDQYAISESYMNALKKLDDKKTLRPEDLQILQKDFLEPCRNDNRINQGFANSRGIRIQTIAPSSRGGNTTHWDFAPKNNDYEQSIKKGKDASTILDHLRLRLNEVEKVIENRNLKEEKPFGNLFYRDKELSTIKEIKNYKKYTDRQLFAFKQELTERLNRYQNVKDAEGKVGENDGNKLIAENAEWEGGKVAVEGKRLADPLNSRNNNKDLYRGEEKREKYEKKRWTAITEKLHVTKEERLLLEIKEMLIKKRSDAIDKKEQLPKSKKADTPKQAELRGEYNNAINILNADLDDVELQLKGKQGETQKEVGKLESRITSYENRIIEINRMVDPISHQPNVVPVKGGEDLKINETSDPDSYPVQGDVQLLLARYYSLLDQGKKLSFDEYQEILLKEQDKDSENEKKQVDRELERLGRRRINTLGDGDCLFNSVSNQSELGLSVSELRNIVAYLIEDNRHLIQDWLPGGTSIANVADEIRNNGRWAGNTGDYAPNLIATALGRPITIVLNGATLTLEPNQNMARRVNLRVQNEIVVVYSGNHYDATLPMKKSSEMPVKPVGILEDLNQMQIKRKYTL
ncbi:OTU domain-containing protein [uncultured Shewanella sp.]|uniref:OTU domain-containing protein n=1 Tax=uncultured Shewanella sp. TaxID=173975 RepID=UPI002616C777|nr:OTU domain-containing protein [uncultured Shewanella sp.]